LLNLVLCSFELRKIAIFKQNIYVYNIILSQNKEENMNDDPILKQLSNIEKSTGKTVAEWVKIVKDSALEKHGELVNMLKVDYQMGHGNANTLVHYAKQSRAGGAEDITDWISEQYKDKPELKTWYDQIMKFIHSLGSDIEIAPKKAYVSLRRKKQFAIIQPSTKTRLDVGINLKNETPGGIAEAGSSWNAMCTHRIRVESEKTLGDELNSWIRKAYESAG
jgi:predicted transport protein